jgi:hypothetical protein
MFSYLTKLLGSRIRSGGPARARAGRRRQGFPSRRPQVEALEDRLLMSVNVLKTFRGIYYDDFGSAVSLPDANPSLAAGPKSLVETANVSIAFINKSTGKMIYEDSLRHFFAPLKPNGEVWDPTVTYDEPLGRFVVVVQDVYRSDFGAGKNASYLDVAISKTSDPGTGNNDWIFKQVTMTQGGFGFAGVPKIGWNYDALVVSVTVVVNPVSNKVFAFDQSTLKNTNPAAWKYYVTNRPDPNIFVPATMHGSKHGDPMWFAESQLQTSGPHQGEYEEVAVKMTNVLSNSPSFTTDVIGRALYFPPAAAAPQPGTILTIGVNPMIQHVSWRNNRLVTAWVTAHVDLFGQAGPDTVVWEEDDTSSGHATLVEIGWVGDQATSFYDPAIEIDPHMNLGMTFVESSPNQYQTMYVTGQAAANVGKTNMQTPVVTHLGQAIFDYGNLQQQPPPDVYAGISVDPVTGTFWAANKFMPGGLTGVSWGTGIDNFSIT